MKKMGRSLGASLLGQTPGVFKGVISYSIALQTRVVYPKGWLMKTPGVLSGESDPHRIIITSS
jgi:hypothetical protein